MRPTATPPTGKQLAYLKALAQQTATSFAYPHNRADASRQIERLRQLPALAREHQGDDGPADRDDREPGPDTTAPALGEVAGHGSSASWHGQAARR